MSELIYLSDTAKDQLITEMKEILNEMVEMINSGDESGSGSDWHIRAEKVLTKAGEDYAY